ncbi:unnamed protein product [Arabidopsis thaliana]|uniref:Uncharacterized protein n=2 Tax=Arabidopsis thaliana TaxID=3702 RepID=A0A654F0S6_ARATH|nr:uncharacterized protein AT2G41105 [Arabidopsis thaliana]ANM62662.1 hypothetical protein AT2G41105 [Arabidopsis thaliana]CAA0376083.1 unnamed protein product [Arabidopsis thaliana]VYS55143.1 unnamed protein product [Arabidopsis thaliana]|eukprot:NP_001324804.1 hypothetical protein AT2G41105 [Arabidopsis thaliana]
MVPSPSASASLIMSWSSAFVWVSPRERIVVRSSFTCFEDDQDPICTISEKGTMNHTITILCDAALDHDLDS